MPRRALIVEFELKPGSRPAFEAVMHPHARQTVADEPGCLQFDVLYPDEDENRVLLIEVYQDDAALEAHRQGPRMPGVNAALEPLTAHRTRVLGSLV